MLVITGAGDTFCAGRPQGPAGPLRPSDGLHSPLRGQRPGGVAGALADALALVFIHRSKDVNRELVGGRIVNRNKLGAGFHQTGEEVDVAAQPNAVTVPLRPGTRSGGCI